MPQESPRVSVIMPAFNAAPYLLAAIESVKSQTFSRWELLVVIDGATDDSESIAEQAARDEPRIRVLFHPEKANRGVSASRNLAAAHARSELLAFLDSDDVWMPDKLERQLAALEQAPSDTVIAFSRATRMDERGHPLAGPSLGYGKARATWAYGDFLQGDIDAPTLTVLLEKRVLLDLGGFPEGLSYQVEDFITWARAMKRGRALFIDVIAAAYRIHDTSATGGLSVLQRIEARTEGLCRIADTEGLDGDIALAMVRLAKAALSDRSSPIRERLRLASSVMKELSTRGGLTPRLGSSIVQRRLQRPRRQRVAQEQ